MTAINRRYFQGLTFTAAVMVVVWFVVAVVLHSFEAGGYVAVLAALVTGSTALPNEIFE